MSCCKLCKMKEIEVEELVTGQTYTFFWGPYDVIVTGIFVESNKNGIADFIHGRNANGEIANFDEDGITEFGVASAGPFFQKQ